MSINNKHLLAAAIVGSLASLSAQAQVTLGTAATAATYAAEVTVPANTNLANPSPGPLTINTRVGFAFSQSEQRNARLECSPNIRFNDVGTPTVAGAAVGPVNGLGSNAISFSITATAGAGVATNAAIVIAPAATAGVTLLSRGNVNCTYGLYDTASQAANGGTLGLINQSVTSGAYIAFATTPSFALGATGANATAALAPTPAYSTFIPGGGSGTGLIATGVAPLGNITFGLVTPARLNTDGTPITLAALLATGAGTAGSAHVVSGNFDALRNADNSFTGAALDRLYIATGTSCTDPAGRVPASTLAAGTAEFRDVALIRPVGGAGTGTVGGVLCFAPRSGAIIPAAGPYTFGFNAVSQAPTVFTVSNLAPLNIGQIFREGAQLVAPLAQLPTGWLSRLVINNTGPQATFTVTLTPGSGGSTSEGSSAFTGPLTTGTLTLPTGTTILAVGDLFPAANFTGAPRGTLTVTANTPRANVNGLYQIVNPASGSISNHVMVSPGTN